MAAVRHLPEGKRRIGFVSEMCELGKFSDGLHDEVGLAMVAHLDLLYCVGPAAQRWEKIWRAAGKRCIHLPDREALLEAALAEVCAGDVLLFKGSRVYALDEVASQVLKTL